MNSVEVFGQEAERLVGDESFPLIWENEDSYIDITRHPRALLGVIEAHYNQDAFVEGLLAGEIDDDALQSLEARVSDHRHEFHTVSGFFAHRKLCERFVELMGDAANAAFRNSGSVLISYDGVDHLVDFSSEDWPITIAEIFSGCAPVLNGYSRLSDFVSSNVKDIAIEEYDGRE